MLLQMWKRGSKEESHLSTRQQQSQYEILELNSPTRKEKNIVRIRALLLCQASLNEICKYPQSLV